MNQLQEPRSNKLEIRNSLRLACIRDKLFLFSDAELSLSEVGAQHLGIAPGNYLT